MFLQSMNPAGLGDISPEEYLALHDALRHQGMRKAMTAGYGGPAAAGGSGDALVPQSLEGTLASATFRKEDAIFWQLVSKKQVYATVNEFTRLEKHGEAELDPFFAEGGNPAAAVTSFTRAFSKIAYMGVQGAVTFPMLRSKVIGGQPNAEAVEVMEKTLHLLGRIEYACYFADSRVNPYAFDGLRSTLEQFAPNNIVDMRGQVLTGKQIRTDMASHRDLHALPTHVLMANGVRADLGNMGESSIRRPVMPGQSAAGQKLGMRAEGIEADHGYVPFRSTIFLQAGGTYNTVAIQPDSSKSPPSQPAAFSGAAAQVDTAALFTSDELGVYTYVAVAVGPNGVSLPRTSAGVTLDATGKRIRLTFDDAAVSDVWYYRIFRSVMDGAATTAKFIANIKKNPAGATVFDDLDKDLPSTTWAFSIQMTPDVVEVIRLLDFMKQDLAIRSTTKEFMLIMFAALRSRTPTKMWAWKNCGRLA